MQKKLLNLFAIFSWSSVISSFVILFEASQLIGNLEYLVEQI